MSYEDYSSDPLFNPMVISGHGLPGVWRYMLPSDFAWLKLPAERLADCSDCPMVAIGEFIPSSRCCTHFAQIPNFQLGLALKDPRTRERTRSVIEKGYALPEGIELTPTHFVASTKAYAEDLFGKSDALICPFLDLDSGGCAIYAFRNSICATFHCGHDHCGAGVKYWERIEQLVGRVETALGQWVMEAVGMDPVAYLGRCDQLADRVADLAGDDPKSWSVHTRRHLWGDWFGREEAFFEACADQVMAHRDELWEIAAHRPLLMAFEYDSAVERLVSGAPPNPAGTVPGKLGDPIPISDLWYKLQLATRRLWELPYNEGQVVLNERVVIVENPKDDPTSRLYAEKPYKLICSDSNGGASEMFLTRSETAVIRLFETPRIIGEALLLLPELCALEAPKDFLAECMRCEVLCRQSD